MTHHRPSSTSAACVVVSSFFALVPCACHPWDAHRPPGPMSSALLAFAAEAGGAPVEVARAWPALGTIAHRVADRRRERSEGAIEAMNAVIFGELRFQREIERDDLDVMTLPSVVANKKGSCVGLGALYLAVAERLDVALEGVMVPGHFFVRVPGPQGRNVELLRRGEAMPDSWYVEKYGPWAPQATFYLRGLSVFEVIAVYWFNAGNEAQRSGDLDAAGRAYARAVASFPAFAEAAASLGAVRQLQGDLSGARDAYQAAARSRPDLPGLGQNLSVLKTQQQLPTSKDAAAPPPEARRRAPVDRNQPTGGDAAQQSPP